MIIKSYEINKYFDKKKVFLFYGENAGLKEEIIEKLYTLLISFLLHIFFKQKAVSSPNLTRLLCNPLYFDEQESKNINIIEINSRIIFI